MWQFRQMSGITTNTPAQFFSLHNRRFQKTNTPITKTPTQEQTQGTEENPPVTEARNMQEVKVLLAKGYKYEMDFDGIKLFTQTVRCSGIEPSFNSLDALNYYNPF